MTSMTPSPRAPAPDLPMEILFKVFDDLERLSDLVRGSHVSRNWRHAARAHSMYWNDITITANDIEDSVLRLLSNKLRFAAARLGAAPEGRPVNLRLETATNCCCLYGTTGSDRVGDFCRGPLRKHIPIIQRLVVNYSDVVLGAVADALSTGSTSMQFLELSAGFHLLYQNSSIRLVRRMISFLRRTFQPDSECYLDVHSKSVLLDRHPVPAHLHTYVPNLCTLRLNYVELPDMSGQVFPNVQRLWLNACRGVPLCSLVRRFPRLRHLALERREDEYQFLAVTAANTDWLASLESIGTDEHFLLMQILTEHNVRVPNVIFLPAGINCSHQIIRDALRAWIDHNAEALALSVIPFNDDFCLPAHRGDTARLDVTDVMTGHVWGLRVLTLEGQLRDYLGQPREISLQSLGLHRFAGRIVRMCLPVAVVPRFLMSQSDSLRFPKLTRLDLEVGGKMGDFLQDPTSTMSDGQLPQLEEVRFIRSSWLQPGVGVSVSVEPRLLVELLLRILRGPRPTVIVRFKSVRFDMHVYDCEPEDLTVEELVSRHGKT